jgi:hypothetical protein
VAFRLYMGAQLGIYRRRRARTIGLHEQLCIPGFEKNYASCKAEDTIHERIIPHALSGLENIRGRLKKNSQFHLTE